MKPIIALLILYFVAVVALALARRSSVPGKAIYLLRALFPSWRFFEDIGHVPALFYRVGETEATLGPWLPCLEKPKRSLSAIFLNPQGNSLLAFGSILQQLESDISELDESRPEEIESSVSYQLTRSLVRHRISSDRVFYQFKVSARDPLGRDSSDDILVSPVYHQAGDHD